MSMQVTEGTVIALHPNGGFRIRHESGGETEVRCGPEQSRGLVVGEEVSVFGGRGGGPDFLCSSISRASPPEPAAPPRPWWRFWGR